MRVIDHVRLIHSILAQSVFASIFAVVLLIFSASGFVFNYVLSDAQKKMTAGFIQSSFGYWEYLLFASLLILVCVLYRRLVPRVSIEFKDDGRFCTAQGAIRTYRVDLVNHGDWQDEISYRIDHIQDRHGTHILSERMGMQREAGAGPMPLSPESPKYGYLVRLDESSPTSEIEVLTLSSKVDGYKSQPTNLPRGDYVLSVSLNPRQGRPYKAIFDIGIDGAGHLKAHKK